MEVASLIGRSWRASGVLLVGPDEAGVPGLGLHQLLVAVWGDDLTCSIVHDFVGEADGRRPVGDENHRRRQVGGLETAQDLRLHRRVDGRGGVVEDQDPRPADQGPGESDPLALPSRQGGAPLADAGVVAVGQLGDELVGAGHDGGLHDRLLAVVPTQGDVAGDGVVEQERVLGDECDLRGSS